MTFGRIVAITIAASVFALSATAQQPRNPRAEQTVSDAGYQPADQTALIRALLDANSSVASAAATLLARFPATTESITALNAAAGDPDEVRALAALTTLQFLGAKGWEPDALVRLANMKAGYKQITLAGILARAGRGEGWHFVRLALEAAGPPTNRSDGSLIAIAVQNTAYFDGLRDLDGEAIDAETELVRARTTVLKKAPHAVGDVDRVLEEVRVNRNASRR